MRALVIEDHPRMSLLLRKGLEEEGYAVDAALTATDGVSLATEYDFDVVVLDVMLPDGDGIDALRRFREHGRWAPVLILTARDAVEDRVRGLDAGADDYLVKPFATEELLARVRALLRRGLAPETMLAHGDLSLDLDARRAARGDRRVELSMRESELLALLLRNARRVVSREQAVAEIWDGEAHENVVDHYISSLRRKLGEPPLIDTVRGIGFVLGR